MKNEDKQLLSSFIWMT